MFKPGDKLIVTLRENGTTDYLNMTVLECEDGLLKVESDGKITVINMRSIAFVKATYQ